MPSTFSPSLRIELIAPVSVVDLEKLVVELNAEVESLKAKLKD